MCYDEHNAPSGDSQARSDETTSFLEIVFEGVDRGHLSLWWRGTGNSRHVDLAKPGWAMQAAELVAESPQDAYYGVCLRGRDLGPHRRGDAGEIVLVPGFWADLDLAVDGRERPDLPTTADQLLAFLDRLPLRPSLIVHSGRGLQPLWLLREPEPIEDEAHRAQLEEASRAWQRYILAAGLASGWRFDDTADLARCLRLPGSVNTKTTERPRVLRATDYRYDLSDFSPYAVDPPAAKQAPAAAGPIPEGQRSTALTSLAGAMRRRGATEQAIAAALLAENQARCTPPLPDAEVRGIAHSVARYRPDAVPELPEEALARISAALQVDVARILKLGADDAVYDLVLADGRRVTLGSAADVLTATRVRAAILDATGVVIRRFTAKAWDEVAEAIATAAELIDTGSRDEIFREHLQNFLAGQPQTRYDLTSVDTKRELLGAKPDAFRDTTGRWWVTRGALLGYLQFHAGMRWTEKAVADALERLGCSRDQLQARDGDRVLSSRRWVTPADIGGGA